MLFPEDEIFVETGRILYFYIMAFVNEIYHFKKIFRDIEKATRKYVHLNGASEQYIIYYLIQIN